MSAALLFSFAALGVALLGLSGWLYWLGYTDERAFEHFDALDDAEAAAPTSTTGAAR